MEKRPSGLFPFYLPVGLADLVIEGDARTVLAIRQQANCLRCREKASREKRPRTGRGQSDREEVTGPEDMLSGDAIHAGR